MKKKESKTIIIPASQIDFNSDDIIRLSTAARRRRVHRQAMYYRVEMGHLPVAICDNVRYVRISDVDNLRFRAK